jgi:hypothetical protein
MPRGGAGRGQGRKKLLPSPYHEFIAGMIVDDLLRAEQSARENSAIEEYEGRETTRWGNGPAAAQAGRALRTQLGCATAVVPQTDGVI